MMTRDADKKRSQMLMFCMDDMVPQDHLLRKIDRAIDWNFIYDLVEDKYCADVTIQYPVKYILIFRQNRENKISVSSSF